MTQAPSPDDELAAITTAALLRIIADIGPVAGELAQQEVDRRLAAPIEAEEPAPVEPVPSPEAPPASIADVSFPAPDEPEPPPPPGPPAITDLEPPPPDELAPPLPDEPDLEPVRIIQVAGVDVEALLVRIRAERQEALTRFGGLLSNEIIARVEQAELRVAQAAEEQALAFAAERTLLANFISPIVTEQSEIRNLAVAVAQAVDEPGEDGQFAFLGRVRNFISAPFDSLFDAIGNWFVGEVRDGLNR